MKHCKVCGLEYNLEHDLERGVAACGCRLNDLLAHGLARYLDRQYEDVVKVFVSVAKPNKNGEMAIDLTDVEEPLGLPKGFFSKALAAS
ncbi:hypothetical protein ACX1C1_05260 [Paenibacillus sp. strain BS8-2]